MQTIKQIFREPLFHFLILGALLYVYFALFTNASMQPSKQEIVLTQYELKQLAQQSALQDKELLQSYLQYKRTLLADAYSLELYKEDAAIERMLLQKMEYILQANAKVQEPTEKELERYYKEHLEDFSTPKQFDLIYKKFPQGSDEELVRKLAIFSDLNKTQNLQKLQAITPAKLQQRFGKYYTLKILSLPQNYWSEPFKINGEVYLFLITNKQNTTPKPFEDVEGKVYAHYIYTKQIDGLRKAYKQILQNYTVKIEE